MIFSAVSVSTQRHASRALVLRHLSVKELGWCSPGSTRPRKARSSNMNNDHTTSTNHPAIERFSIVAAMTSDRIIGVHGNKFPWSDLPEDREIFCSLTKNKILILGRKTLEERDDLSHIRHAKHYIAVSKTIPDASVLPRVKQEKDDGSSSIRPHLARSFPEALGIARHLLLQESEEAESLDPSLCWVVGGERLYNEAVKHSAAEEIHLSVVDASRVVCSPASITARFPPNYWWDHRFRRHKSEAKDGFTYEIYKRHRGY